MNPKDSKRLLLGAIIVMIIAAGGRYHVGADFPIYKNMYEEGFPLYTTYADVWDKATFQPNSMELEWAFVLLNKILYDLGLPFYALTFVMATLALTILYKVLTKYSSFPGVSFIFYYLPLYFIVECGQMRQGMGGALVLLSVPYILERKMWKFLLVMFIALGFHKSVIVFVPAYWLVKLPFNAKTWTTLVIISVFLAPFQVYKLFGGAFESLMPQDVSNAYTGYENDRYYGNAMETSFADVFNIFFIIILLAYDKIGTKKVYYYEYFRNLAFFGFCLFYILRGNEIFATRLPGSYFTMAGYFMVPGIIACLEGERKYLMKYVMLGYFIMFYILFSMGNAKRGNFTWGSYQNVIWSKTTY